MTEAIALLITWLAAGCWVALEYGIIALRRDGHKPHRYHERAAFMCLMVMATAGLTWFSINNG